MKPGDRYDKEAEIIEGINEGETVATINVDRLDTGVQVRVTRSAN